LYSAQITLHISIFFTPVAKLSSPRVRRILLIYYFCRI